MTGVEGSGRGRKREEVERKRKWEGGTDVEGSGRKRTDDERSGRTCKWEGSGLTWRRAEVSGTEVGDGRGRTKTDDE